MVYHRQRKWLITKTGSVAGEGWFQGQHKNMQGRAKTLLRTLRLPGRGAELEGNARPPAE